MLASVDENALLWYYAPMKQGNVLEKQGNPEEIIIRDILSKKDIIPDEDGKTLYAIEYGSKKMEITYDPGSLRYEFSTYVENVEGRSREENETTLLYKAVSIIMQDIANSEGKVLEYVWTSAYAKLKKWGDTKGREIFLWEDGGEYEYNKAPTDKEKGLTRVMKIYRKRFLPMVENEDVNTETIDGNSPPQIPAILERTKAKAKKIDYYECKWLLAVEEAETRFPGCHVRTGIEDIRHDERLIEYLELVNKEGESMGKIQYTYNNVHKGLFVELIEVPENFRGNKISRALYAHVLLRNPQVTSITGDQGMKNLEIYKQGIQNGLTIEEAIKATPSYKAKVLLGFTNVDIGLFVETPGYGYAILDISREDLDNVDKAA